MTDSEKLILKSIKKQNEKIKALKEDYKELLDLVTIISNKVLDEKFD